MCKPCEERARIARVAKENAHREAQKLADKTGVEMVFFKEGNEYVIQTINEAKEKNTIAGCYQLFFVQPS